jgi:alpha,alpha-trehalase
MTVTRRPIFSALAGLALFSQLGFGASPQELYGPLFDAVQREHLFYDGKEFADATPKQPVAAIMDAYRNEKPQSHAALKNFVARHFTLPEQARVPLATNYRPPLIDHIKALWPKLVRKTTNSPPGSSLIPLPHSYVVPGGRFREMYYWDSYFTMLGLAESGRQDLVNDMVKNFASLIDRYGHIPNGTRSYYLSRSQPPFFYAMVALTEPKNPAKAYARYLKELKREYAFWMKGAARLKAGTARERVVAMPDGSRLNRYWDDNATPRDESYLEDVELTKTSKRPSQDIYRDIRTAAESGWDFSSRWLSDGKSMSSIATGDVVPVDLNSLLFALENAIAEGCQATNDHSCALEFSAHAAARKAAITRYLWNAKGGFYTDYRWRQNAQSTELSAATFYPLFTDLADKTTASQVAARGKADLLKAGGLVTTMAITSQQWDAPNGWAPLQWIAVDGLRRYKEPLAAVIACRWSVTVGTVYRQSGKLVEKYDVVTLGKPGGGGEYQTQDGFGWTNGVTQKLLALYPAFARYRDTRQCPAP